MPILVKQSVTRIELWTGKLSWWKCHRPDLKSAGLFRRNLFLNSLKTSTQYSLLTVCPVGTQCMQIMPVLSKKRDHQKFVGGFALSGLLGSGRASMLPLGTLSLGHSSRTRFYCMAFFPSLKQNLIAYRSSKVQIAFLKVTSCDNQAFVGCIPIPAVAILLNLKS